MDLSGLQALLVVSIVAALAPLVASMLPGPRIAQVVLLLLGGIAIGPQGLGVDPSREVELISNVGVGFLFLLAGYELDTSLIRSRVGRFAVITWLVAVALAAAVVTALTLAGLVRDFVPIAIALTTTALGTLLPILHDNDLLGGEFGRHVMAVGATGEVLPILAIALFLSVNSEYVALLALLSIALVAALLGWASRGVRGRAIERIVLEGADTTAQSTLRWTIVLLLALLVATGEFGIDAVLGAFVAGAILRRWVGDEAGRLSGKLDAIGYGFFIPVFFVFSGMNVHLDTILAAPGRLFGFLGFLLLVRAVPVYVLYRWALPRIQRLQLSLCAATTLPLLVALAEIGRRNGSMLAANAAALVGAGILSVLLFPTIVIALKRWSTTPDRAR